VGKWNLINRMLMPIIYTEGQNGSLDIDRNFGDINWGGNLGSLGFGSAFGLGDITYQGFITPKKAGEIAWGLMDRWYCLLTQINVSAQINGLRDQLPYFFPRRATGCSA
jgi:hypothetical protein